MSILLGFCIWTILNLTFLPNLKSHFTLHEYPLISVLVPMRNEARNVQNCIAMLKNIRYENIEIIIYEDQSTDSTYSLLLQEIGDDTRFQVIRGEPLKEGWIGKVHACYQLRQHAHGRFLAFIDADVTLHQHALTYAIARAKQYNASLVTGFPKFHYTNWLDKMLIPMMHFIVYFHLPIALANFTKIPATTAANGAFMFFETASYDQIGGHEAVKSSLVEDIHIAQILKRNGHRVLLTNVTDCVHCHMYETSKETWEGFSKNIFVGIGRSIPMALGLTLFYSLLYIVPFIFGVYGVTTWQPLFILPFIITVIHRMICDIASKTPIVYSLGISGSVVALLCILWRSVVLSKTGASYTWKGRSYK